VKAASFENVAWHSSVVATFFPEGVDDEVERKRHRKNRPDLERAAGAVKPCRLAEMIEGERQREQYDAQQGGWYGLVMQVNSGCAPAGKVDVIRQRSNQGIENECDGQIEACSFELRFAALHGATMMLKSCRIAAHGR
jgi:hypothetical protein